MPCCASYGCSNRTEDGKRLFRFPRDPTRRKQWEVIMATDNSYLCEVSRCTCIFENLITKVLSLTFNPLFDWLV